ncbi:glycogen synthase, partial [Phenoliferia sp. Uapishka_3]
MARNQRTVHDHTKAPVTVREYGDRYLLVGVLAYKTAPMEVDAIDWRNPEAGGAALGAALTAVLTSMSERGVKFMYGRWLIEGAPRVLLFDTSSVRGRLDEWKADLWNLAAIPTPSDDQETNETILLGYLTTWFLGELAHHEQSRAIIAHFHEWQTGVAIALCRRRALDVTTIFTTHATLLGRYLCAGSVDFYNNLQYFDVDHEAGKRGIYHRYCIERSAAHCADVFTTVSHITAYESEHLLKRKPDGVLPNGLNVTKFSAMHEFQNLHQVSKQKISDFIRGHFYGHYDFDLDNTLYFFTAGRYEYRNKGVDMFIESLARLNFRLQEMGTKMTVVAFIILPAATNSYTIEALKGQAVTKQLRDTVTEIQNRIGARLFERTARYSGEQGTEVPDAATLLSDEDKILLKRRVLALRRNSLPPVTTHNMADDANDPVLNQIRRVQLFNRSSDRVKVIFHPEFLNANNPILGLDYEEFVRGCHLGVFPSYYEPWGYTPAGSHWILATKMDLAHLSFSQNVPLWVCRQSQRISRVSDALWRFVVCLSGTPLDVLLNNSQQELIENSQDYGIYIVDRRAKSVEDSVNQLTDQMVEFCQKTRRQRINQRNRTERLSDLLDWKRMGLEYAKARQLALRRAYPDSFSDDDFDFEDGNVRIPRPMSAPGSPRFLSGMMTPGDLGTLTEEMQGLGTSDYMGAQSWESMMNQTKPDEDEDTYPFPLVLKKQTKNGSVSSGLASGQTTPGGANGRSAGRTKVLSEGDLLKADEALSHHNGGRNGY